MEQLALRSELSPLSLENDELHVYILATTPAT